MKPYKISVFHQSVETPIDENLSAEEAYQSFLDYLDPTDNIFCETTGGFYFSGEWIYPDSKDDIWDTNYSFIPSQKEVVDTLNQSNLFIYSFDNNEIKISRM